MKIITNFILPLILFFCLNDTNAQTVKSYEKEWAKADAFIKKKDLPKSALEEVKKIYTLAKKEKQEAQILKAVIYMTTLQQQLREESEQKSISEIKKEITISKEPVTSILNSYLATLYWQYFQQNRWQLYNRTPTTKMKNDDVLTWSLEDFHKEISEIYLTSIQNKKTLQQTRLLPYDAIIEKGNVRYLRPSLYDLLAFKALDYFKNDERELKKPSYAFEISGEEAFAPAEQFIKANFKTKDSLSLQHKALLIYQELLRYHLNDEKKDAFIDADIERLNFVYSNSVHEDKQALYITALQNMIHKWGLQPTALNAHFALAQVYEELASSYNALADTTYRYYRIMAKDILEKVIKERAEKSEGWIKSFNLLNDINRPIFSYQIEKVNVPELPFRALVKYKNVTQLHFRLLKLNDNIKRKLKDNKQNEYWSLLIKEQPIRKWQQLLPATADLQEHATEIKIEALPIGEYILLASPDPQFTVDKVPLGAHTFYVSNISYVHQANKLYAMHRQSGQPLKNAEVKAYVNEYDYNRSAYIKTLTGSFSTNEKGFITIGTSDNKKASNNNSIINLYYEKDSLKIDEQIYNYYPDYSEESDKQRGSKNIFLFTDRAIYRPGQTVFYKGIVLNKKSNTVLANYKTKIFLQSANYEKVDSAEVTTNEFGSVWGNFVLPQNVLNGQFSIEDKEELTSIFISVEEYKRPKFHGSFEPVKESYKVGDSITVTGSAKGYAGNVINNASVNYRVVRQARFIYPWMFRSWWPQVQPMEITHGVTAIDENGIFNIQFKALPDKTVLKKLEPIFDYIIYADITDITGETRSAEYQVSAGYKSLVLHVKTKDRIAIDSIPELFISTENLAGQFQPSFVKISVTKLVPPNRLIRKRYWQQPDKFIMNKDEFIKAFPHDEYNNESDHHNWEKGAKVFEGLDSTKKDASIKLENFTKEPGYFEIEITTKDKDGAEVKDVQYVERYNESRKELAHPAYLWVAQNNTTIEPGATANIQIGTSAKDVYLIEEMDKNDSTVYFAELILNNEKITFAYKASEKNRGGFGVSYFFVKDNRFYQYTHVINVPWSNKDLKIDYATFRDKTLPGSEEKWTVRISGAKGDKVAAEMLASMYDASLDQFKLHQWIKPDIWPQYVNANSWNGSVNFSAIESEQNYVNEEGYKTFDKRYDVLKFDLYTYGGSFFMPKGRQMRDMVTMNSEVMSSEVVVTAARGINKDQSGKKIYNDTIAGNENQLNSNDKKEQSPEKLASITTRKNFNETAFFFPDLHTDKDGNIQFSFTAPEALTKWKLQTLAHTKELLFGLSEKEMVTQKELMVQPNLPRFLREGDRLEISAKIVNLSTEEFTGQAQLQLIDATTNQSVDGWFQNIFPNQYFTVAAGKSEAIKFPIEVPYQFNKALTWRIVAKAGAYSDGEEAFIPVLTNRTLVTETMPLPMRGEGTKSFTFTKLLQSGNSETLQQHGLTLEYTSNPAWYAVQALPYLIEYPFDCSEQIWNGFYANTIASHITKTAPRIKEILQKWKEKDTTALLSNLQKNEELKAVLLQETPWVLQAKTEAEQKKNIALLFDLVRMSADQQRDLKKLVSFQSSNGGFVWFKGGPDDRYMTQYITTGIGHLKKLKALPEDEYRNTIDDIAAKAISYLDKKIKEDYDYLIKNKADLKQQQINYTQYQYLYMRSFFSYKMEASIIPAYAFYKKQAQQNWMKANRYMQGMAALALYRSGDVQTPKAILASLKENAIVTDELGMYWKEAHYRYQPYWWYASVETAALLIEAFSEVGKDTISVDNIKTWLIKNKQTTHWSTSKATADACYAFLIEGSNWLVNEPSVTVLLGNIPISSKDANKEAGTGYFKQNIDGAHVKPEMGNIKVTLQQQANPSGSKHNNAPTWGAVYWQYFEDLDKITTANTSLQITKKLFIQKTGDRGPVLTPIDEDRMQVGDKIVVRIELKTDRDLEYVHLKDMRASGFEPVNVLSGYKWQGGLGYYETTKDASTNFFINYLRKGTYVFEYPVFVTSAGNFSNGITSVQCMYAPEFSAHSEGVRVRVE